jgi:hypothetical protein
VFALEARKKVSSPPKLRAGLDDLTVPGSLINWLCVKSLVTSQAILI